MSTLVYYDHARKVIVVMRVPKGSDPEFYVPDSAKGKHKEQDPYWHSVDGKWDVEQQGFDT